MHEKVKLSHMLLISSKHCCREGLSVGSGSNMRLTNLVKSGGRDW